MQMNDLYSIDWNKYYIKPGKTTITVKNKETGKTAGLIHADSMLHMQPRKQFDVFSILRQKQANNLPKRENIFVTGSYPSYEIWYLVDQNRIDNINRDYKKFPESSFAKELKEKIDEEIIHMQEISDNGINVIYSRIHY